MRGLRIGVIIVIGGIIGSAHGDPKQTRQELVDALIGSAHAYWAQRVVIRHPAGTYYGFSGKQTVVDSPGGADRYYDSDGGWIREPHLFVEQEITTGHAGVGMAYVVGYEATGDKFLARAAKALGDAALSAQRDNGSGGWSQDMGVIGFDRQQGSRTYKRTVDYGRWVSYFPWGGRGNVMDRYQNVGTFDGVSHLYGYFLLRLSQALPPEDPDRPRYREGARMLADTIAGLSKVVDAARGFAPYARGGIPQVFPYRRMIDRPGIDESPGYPFDIPHNLMITLNDQAMVSALFFLVEFWKEARRAKELDECRYLAAVRLNIDYLLSVYEAGADSNGRGAWASQYWVEDGSVRAGRPTWGRAMEPPAVGFFSEAAEDILMRWYFEESDRPRRERIARAVEGSLLYWKYEAPPVNADPRLRRLLRSCPYYDPKRMDRYDRADMRTWYWWLFYNHDPARGPRNTFVSAGSAVSRSNPTLYTAFVGPSALEAGRYNARGYPMIRNTIARKILICLRDDRLDTSHPDLAHHFGLDTQARFFGRRRACPALVREALGLLDSATMLFSPSRETIDGSKRTVVEDGRFYENVRMLAWGITNLDGPIDDADGDGFDDRRELREGTDPNDSEDVPR